MLVGSHHPWSHNARHQCYLKSPLQSLPHWRMASSSLRTSDHPPSWDLSGNKWRFCCQSWCVTSRGKKGGLAHKFERVRSGPNWKGEETSQQNCSPCEVFPVCSGQCLSKEVQGRDVGKLATESGHGQRWLINDKWHEDQKFGLGDLIQQTSHGGSNGLRSKSSF